MNFYTLAFYAILGGLLDLAGTGVLDQPGYFVAILATVMAIDFIDKG